MPKYHCMQKKNGKWYPHVEYQGTRHRAGQGFGTAKEAESWQKRKLRSLKRGVMTGDNTTFGDYVDYYLRHALLYLRKSTILATESRLRLHVIPYLENKKLRSITSIDIQQIQDKLVKKFKTSYVRSIMLSLRHVLQTAFDHELVDRNVAVKVKPPKQVQAAKVIPLNPEQLEYILEEAPIMDRAVIALGAIAGLRISEVFGLKWEDLDLNEEELHVQRQFHLGEVTDLKTASSEAHLPIAPELQVILREWKMASRPSEWVFPSEKDIEIPASGIWWRQKRFVPLLSKLGFQHVKFHDLRHICVSLWLGLGMPPKQVQVLSRHASIKMLDLYGHAIPEHVKNFVRQNPILPKAYRRKNLRKTEKELI